jgi:hypothetical protein
MRYRREEYINNYNNGIFAKEWHGFDEDILGMLYFDSKHPNLRKFRSKHCYGKIPGPWGPFYYFNTLVLNQLSEEELKEFISICEALKIRRAFEDYIIAIVREKKIVEKLALSFECKIEHVNRFNVDEMLEVCDTMYRLTLKLHSKNKDNIDTYKYIDKKTDRNPYKLPTFEDFLKMRNSKS